MIAFTIYEGAERGSACRRRAMPVAGTPAPAPRHPPSEVVAMHSKAWSKPVWVEIPLAEPRMICTAAAAADFLRHEWPVKAGPLHDSALVICDEVLMGRRNPEDARAVFQAAVAEARQN